MGRRPIGKTAMTGAERHKRYIARLRARAAAAGDNATHDKSAPGWDIRLEWEIQVDDEGESYVSAYEEPYGLYIRQIGYDDDLPFSWHVNRDPTVEGEDCTDVAEGDAPSLVAAMAAAEAAIRR
jgi:hypothetical protein